MSMSSDDAVKYTLTAWAEIGMEFVNTTWQTGDIKLATQQVVNTPGVDNLIINSLLVATVHAKSIVNQIVKGTTTEESSNNISQSANSVFRKKEITSRAHDHSIEMIDTVNNAISLSGKENIQKKEKRRWQRKRIPNRASGGVQIAKRKKTETRKQRTQWNKNNSVT